MARFIRRLPDHPVIQRAPKCDCGIHQSKLECSAARELEKMGVRYVYEDLDERFTGYVPDFRIVDMPPHLRCGIETPAYVEIKPNDFIKCAMDELSVTLADVRDAAGERRGFWENTLSPEAWKRRHSDEMSKIQAFVDFFNEEYGWNRPILITEAIGQHERTSMLVEGYSVFFSRVHPFVCYQSVCREAIRNSRRIERTPELRRLLESRFQGRRIGQYGGSCSGCGSYVEPERGLLSDNRHPDGWKKLCGECFRVATGVGAGH